MILLAARGTVSAPVTPGILADLSEHLDLTLEPVAGGWAALYADAEGRGVVFHTDGPVA